ncbi:hypothetical protein BvCmsB39A_02965 [Escherichia coli]|nr:hypothetical protein BvCmsB39A_02965 [Escherichia coli]
MARRANMSLRIDAELKDTFMTAAKNMVCNGSPLIWDFMPHAVKRYS